MPEVVVLEFEAPNAVSLYHRVNAILAGDSDAWEMPPGMISHVAGDAGDKLIVVEVWGSRADQQAFLDSTLGPALHEANAPQPARVEWFSHAETRTATDPIEAEQTADHGGRRGVPWSGLAGALRNPVLPGSPAP